jgi:hypothetical protein
MIVAAYEQSTLERGIGEALLLTKKIKHGDKVFENGSRQVIAGIDVDKIGFHSELELDRRACCVRQGDALMTYKAQGAGKFDMIRVEDNRSLSAMVSCEDLHVSFTQHRATATMFVEFTAVVLKGEAVGSLPAKCSIFSAPRSIASRIAILLRIMQQRDPVLAVESSADPATIHQGARHFFLSRGGHYRQQRPAILRYRRYLLQGFYQRRVRAPHPKAMEFPRRTHC